MKNRFLPILIEMAALAVALVSCANPGGAPGGGPKDMVPPLLLTAQPPQGTVGFQDKVVTMEFDEFIELRDQDKIYASPVLKQVTYSSNLKKLKVEIDDTLLRPDYTYTIRFGNSVVDLHEANPVPDFHYVFSTGTVIDSMYMEGRVVKAVDYKPEKDVRLLFYLHRPDSFPFQDEPDYVAIADQEGYFEAIHMREGCYFVYGLVDENQDYRIDPVTEMMAYTDTCVPVRKMVPAVVLSTADSLALIDSLMQAADSLLDVADSLAWMAAYAAYDADTVATDTTENAYEAYAEAVADFDSATVMAVDTLADAVPLDAASDAFVNLYLYRDYLPAFFLKEVTYKQRDQMAFTFYYPIDSIEAIRFIEVTDSSETELLMPLYWQWAADRRSAIVHFPDHTLKDCDLIMTVNGHDDTTSVYMSDAVRSRTDTARLQLKTVAGKLLVSDTLKCTAAFPITHMDKDRMAVWRFVSVERPVRDTVWLQRDTLLAVEVDTVPMPVTDTLSAQLTDPVALLVEGEDYYLVDTVRLLPDTLVQPFELIQTDAWNWAVLTAQEIDGRYGLFLADSAVFDFFGRGNDSTLLSWQVVAPEEGGDLALEVQGLQAGAVYVLQLMQGDKIMQEVRLTDTGMVEFLALKPAQYTFRMFKDDNDNGQWDEGDYVARRQPEEHWYYHKTLRVEADWRIEDIWRIE